MGLLVKIIGLQKESDEYYSAELLSNIFKSAIPQNVVGEIVIYNNATLYGQNVKDIDLIIVGKLVNYRPKIYIKDELGNLVINPVEIRSFCSSIEIKSHDVSGVYRLGTDIYVKYGINSHNASYQSNEQKYALKNFFESNYSLTPYITNLIWLTNLDEKDVNALLTTETSIMKSNILPNTFDLKYFFQRIIDQRPPFRTNRGYISSSLPAEVDIKSLSNIIDFFSKAKLCAGELTRKKIEQISANQITVSDFFNENDGITVLRGRAGTGKTIGLIQAGLQIVNKDLGRALLLTYNRALVSDIRRLLALVEIPDMFNIKSVSIETVHAFFYHVINKVFYEGRLSSESFINDYDKIINEAASDLKSGLLEINELKNILVGDIKTSWDYALVDEAQDWTEDERDLLLFIFEKNHIIVADGGMQLVRGNKVCDWSITNKKNIRLTQCLRQKNNIINFLNKFTALFGLENPRITGNKAMLGGKVIVSCKDYLDSNIHEIETGRLQLVGNINYDMLYLVPPSLVEKCGEDRRFVDYNRYREANINLWDGTSFNTRSEYSIDLSEYRLLQYDSSRGLEGWTVVCLNFDDFIDYKNSLYNPSEETMTLLLETEEESRKRYLHSWIMIPFTRAIDTLIITLRNKNAPISLLLKKLAEENPDYIEWID